MNEEPEYFIEKELRKDLDRIKKLVTGERDEDIVIIIDGRERSGKSVLALQVAKYLDPKFSINAVCYDPETFTKFILTHRKRAVVYDESITGLNVQRRYEKTTVMLDELLAQSGQQNLYTILVIPFFFELTKRTAIGRGELLLHVYRDAAYRRGSYKVYNYRQKRRLFMLGKRLMEYNVKGVEVSYHGHFRDEYPIDEVSYRKKKKDAFFKYSSASMVLQDWGEIANYIWMANVFMLDNIRAISPKYEKVAVDYARSQNVPASTVLNNAWRVKELIQASGTSNLFSLARKGAINDALASIPPSVKKSVVEYKVRKMQEESEKEEKKLEMLQDPTI